MGIASIPVPASSADSGSRAVVAITQPSSESLKSLMLAEGSAALMTRGTVCGMASLNTEFIRVGGTAYRPVGGRAVDCGSARALAQPTTLLSSVSGVGSTYAVGPVPGYDCPAGFAMKGTANFVVVDRGGSGASRYVSEPSGFSAWCEKL